MLRLYRSLPEELRRCLRPLNLLDEVGALLSDEGRAVVNDVTALARRLRLLARTRYPIRRLEGPGRPDGERLVVLLACDEPSLRYWAPLFFTTPPVEEAVGDVHALRVPGAAARRSGEADLALWQTGWPLWRLARRAPRVPQWVPLWLPTDRSLAAVIEGERSGRAARKNDVRRVERLAFTARVAGDAASFDHFRRALAEPYGRQRFGELFSPYPPHVYRHVRRHGWLLLLERDGRPVAGALIERGRREPRILAFGVDVDGPVPPHAALEACYYHAIAFAVERRFPRLSLGASRPVLTDGVVQYKRKWGGRLGTPITWDGYFLRYRHTRATRAALTVAPLVIDRGDGRLAALVGAAGPAGADLDAHLGRLDTPGLGELACLVEPSIVRAGPLVGRYSPVRIVPPGESWPPEAAAVARPSPAPRLDPVTQPGA